MRNHRTQSPSRRPRPSAGWASVAALAVIGTALVGCRSAGRPVRTTLMRPVDAVRGWMAPQPPARVYSRPAAAQPRPYTSPPPVAEPTVAEPVMPSETPAAPTTPVEPSTPEPVDEPLMIDGGEPPDAPVPPPEDEPSLPAPPVPEFEMPERPAADAAAPPVAGPPAGGPAAAEKRSGGQPAKLGDSGKARPVTDAPGTADRPARPVTSPPPSRPAGETSRLGIAPAETVADDFYKPLRPAPVRRSMVRRDGGVTRIILQSFDDGTKKPPHLADDAAPQRMSSGRVRRLDALTP